MRGNKVSWENHGEYHGRIISQQLEELDCRITLIKENNQGKYILFNTPLSPPQTHDVSIRWVSKIELMRCHWWCWNALTYVLFKTTMRKRTTAWKKTDKVLMRSLSCKENEFGHCFRWLKWDILERDEIYPCVLKEGLSKEQGLSIDPYEKAYWASSPAGSVLERAGIGPRPLREDRSGLGATGRAHKRKEVELGSTTKSQLKYWMTYPKAMTIHWSCGDESLKTDLGWLGCRRKWWWFVEAGMMVDNKLQIKHKSFASKKERRKLRWWWNSGTWSVLEKLYIPEIKEDSDTTLCRVCSTIARCCSNFYLLMWEG